MSLREILDEQPRLTHAERRLVCQRALEIDEADEVACDHSVVEGFALLDRMETGDSEPAISAKHGVTDSELSAAWLAEIRRRVDDIRSGREAGVTGEEVMTRVRKIVGR